MRFARQEDWSGLPFPSSVDFRDPGIKPEYPALAGGFFTTEPSRTLVCAKTVSFCPQHTCFVLGIFIFPASSRVPDVYQDFDKYQWYGSKIALYPLY